MANKIFNTFWIAILLHFSAIGTHTDSKQRITNPLAGKLTFLYFQYKLKEEITELSVNRFQNNTFWGEIIACFWNKIQREFKDNKTPFISSYLFTKFLKSWSYNWNWFDTDAYFIYKYSLYLFLHTWIILGKICFHIHF